MKPAFSDIVTSLGLARELRAAGLNQPSIYAYFPDGTGIDHIAFQDSDQSGIAAYTSQELFELLPAMLKVDINTFQPAGKSWSNIFLADHGYAYAHLHLVKTGSSFIAAYYYENKQIAFSSDEEGRFNNLLTNGETSQEALGRLLLKIIAEGKHLETDI